MVSRSPTGRKNQFKLKNKQILFLTVFGFISSFTLISYANSYYPVAVGNKWVFHGDNGKDRYTIKVTTSEEAANRIEVQRPGAGGPEGQQRLPADIWRCKGYFHPEQRNVCQHPFHCYPA